MSMINLSRSERGLIAVIFGVLAFALPQATLAVLVILWGAYAFAEGVVSLLAAFRIRDTGHPLWPLVIVGDGPDSAKMVSAARRSGRDVRFKGWLDAAATAAWIGHAGMLIFPSRGPESLSRVLIEASALAWLDVANRLLRQRRVATPGAQLATA